MNRARALLLAPLLCATLGGGAIGAQSAFASHGQVTYFEASTQLMNPLTRPRTLAALEYEGVNGLRVELYWHEVAPSPNSATKPSFNATEPSAYNWGQYMPVLEEAQARHWKVLLTITGPAPRWATSNRRAPYITRPDPLDYQQFVTAVAKKFGAEVSLYSIWNEPNHPDYLLPQWNANRTPASPRIYRALFQAGYTGLQNAGIAHPKVLIGETAPTGFESPPKHEGLLHDVAPLLFLRSMLCLNPHYRRAGTCGELKPYGYAHHAYTIAVSPFYRPPLADDVMIGVLGRLTRALELAARAHAIPAGLPIYLTEFGVESKPNQYLGVPVAQQAEYDAIAERIAYENPRVAAFSQYLLRDDPLGGAFAQSATGPIGFQTGLEYVSGARKPLFYGFPVPLTVIKHRHSFSLWGLVRPTHGATKLTVLVQLKGSSRYRTLTTVHTNSRGYWALVSGVHGVHWRVRWTSPAGVRYEGPPIRAH